MRTPTTGIPAKNLVIAARDGSDARTFHTARLPRPRQATGTLIRGPTARTGGIAAVSHIPPAGWLMRSRKGLHLHQENALQTTHRTAPGASTSRTIQRSSVFSPGSCPQAKAKGPHRPDLLAFERRRGSLPQRSRGVRSPLHFSSRQFACVRVGWGRTMGRDPWKDRSGRSPVFPAVRGKRARAARRHRTHERTGES